MAEATSSARGNAFGFASSVTTIRCFALNAYHWRYGECPIKSAVAAPANKSRKSFLRFTALTYLLSKMSKCRKSLTTKFGTSTRLLIFRSQATLHKMYAWSRDSLDGEGELGPVSRS